MNKQKFFTAVSKSPLLIATVLVPLLCLGWVTRLMAQSEPSDLPDFVITQPIPVDVPRADSYQIQFVGLLPDGNEGYLSVDNLSVQPLTETLGIQILTSSVRSLANDPFYVSLVIDTSGSMGLTSTTELSGTEVITQPSNLD
jgi:hypothetical protein